MDEEETELRNPFPSPPSHYQNYTAHNLKLLSLLRERAEPEGIDLSNVNQHAILSDQSDVPEWPLAQLEKPRVDWILEEGHYTVFGDTWQVNLISLSFSVRYQTVTFLCVVDQGEHTIISRTRGTPTVPRRSYNRYVWNNRDAQQLTITPEDRRPALLAILRSMLVTYSSLLGSLLEPPNTVSTASLQPEWQGYVEWITVLSQNLMAAANDLRPMQVRILSSVKGDNKRRIPCS